MTLCRPFPRCSQRHSSNVHKSPHIWMGELSVCLDEWEVPSTACSQLLDLRQLRLLLAFPLTHHTLVTGAFFLFSHAGPWSCYTVSSLDFFPSFLPLFKWQLPFCHLPRDCLTIHPSYQSLILVHGITLSPSLVVSLIATVLHPQIQPTMDRKYSGKKSQKSSKTHNS